MLIKATCHCENIHLALASDKTVAQLPVRFCTCSFCLRHNARYTSDPTGHFEITVRNPTQLGRYRFGLKLADFLFCNCCSVYVGAYEPGEPNKPALAVININVFDARAEFTQTPTPMSFDGEDPSNRASRRMRSWTPARLIT